MSSGRKIERKGTKGGEGRGKKDKNVEEKKKDEGREMSRKRKIEREKQQGKERVEEKWDKEEGNK